MKLKCPKCASPLKLVSFQRLSVDTAKVILLCSRCKTSYEIEIKFKDLEKYVPGIIESELKDLYSRRVSINDLPSTSPYPIKYFVTKETTSYIPIHYTRVMDKPPKKGKSLDIEHLVSLGIPENIADKLVKYWLERGITNLYAFQEKAIKYGISGKNLVIVAPTGTGKTEAFAIPAMVRALQLKRSGYAPPLILIIYPTKALARDQMQKLFDYAWIFNLRVNILDGDTPQSVRKQILMNPPDILLTNFDMIHYHIGKRTPLGSLFPKARIVIIDELHEYSGAFGTHVHYIIKRLKRSAKRLGAVQFIMSSATINNPKEFGSMLVDEDVEVVEEKGRKTPLHILFIYSLDQIQYAVAKILSDIIMKKIKTLAFFNTRRSAELALHILKKIAAKYPEIRNRFDLHRAGLPKKVRISIEKEFKSGKKIVLIATPTLELGIDIGDIDLVLSEITPVNRFIQRSGRTGRRGEPGSAVLVLRNDDPISDYYALNPEDYFEDVSSCYIEPNNTYIAEKHVYLLAYEHPIDMSEIDSLNIPKSIVEKLVAEGALFPLGDKYYANGNVFTKYFTTNIRGADKVVRVIYNGKTIDEREAIIAIRELYPGAIYINRGTKYIVKALDLDALKAEVEKAPKEYEDLYTRPIYTSGAQPIEDMVTRDCLGTKAYYGKLLMRASVEGYVVFQEGSKKPLAEYELDTPIRYKYETFGLVFRAPPIEFPDSDLVAGSYHALEHIIIEGTNVITGGGSEDLGGISFGTTGVIVIYDGTPGGNGVSKLLFERFEKAVEKAYKILSSCRCGDSKICNKCVYSYRCGNNNRPLYQPGALEILKRMLSREPVPDADKALEILRIIEKGIV